jgi:hypothetical protein
MGIHSNAQYSEYVACPCCGETMQFVQTGPHANLGEMQTLESKSCGLVATTEPVGGSMRPLIENDVPIELSFAVLSSHHRRGCGF